jgi:hypothetical protein
MIPEETICSQCNSELRSSLPFFQEISKLSVIECAGYITKTTSTTTTTKDIERTILKMVLV